MSRLAEKFSPRMMLVAAMAISAAMLLAFGSGLTFFQDTWSFLLHRRGFSADVFFAPHNEHIVVAPVAISKLLQELFGMESALPERLVLIVSLLATAGLLFGFVRRRLGDWPALIAAVLLLFLGSAWQVLLWPFEFSLAGSVAAGLAMLVALDRDDSKGDLLACIALIISFTFASLGLAFVVAAAVNVWLRRKERGLGRIYVFLLPLLLYALWYLGFGHEAERNFRLQSIPEAPQYILDSLAAATASLLGLVRPVSESGNVSLDWGRPIAIALIALALWSQVQRPGLALRSLPAGAAALTYFVMTAFNSVPGREATSNRYLHMTAVFALLLAISLLDRRRISPRAILAAGGVAVLAVFGNVAALKDGRAWMLAQTELTRGNLAALEIVRDTVPDEFRLMPDVAGTGSLIDIEAAAYFDAADAYGTPAYSEDELAKAAPHARFQADVVLARALPISHSTTLNGDTEPTAGNCTLLEPGDSTEMPLDPGTVSIAVPPGDPYAIRMRRFADQGLAPFEVAPIKAGSVTTLDIPLDRGRTPWLLSVTSDSPARVCATASPGDRS